MSYSRVPFSLLCLCHTNCQFCFRDSADCLRMSLADELMADLEGSDEEEEAEVKEEDEEMDSEDIKPSKLELEQVLFFVSSILV